MPESDIPPIPAAPLQIPDEFIGTRQLQDLAVTVAKVDDPLQIATAQGRSKQNQSLSTTLTSYLQVEIPIPSWAGACFLIASGRLQWSNTSGADQNVYVICRLEGSTSGTSTEITVENNKTGANAVDYATSVTSPGSTVTVELAAKTNTSTNNQNNSFLSVLALVTR